MAELSENVRLEVESLLEDADPASTLDFNFISLCSSLNEDQLYEVIQRLKKIKGFGAGEFKRRVKAEQAQFAKPRSAGGPNWLSMLMTNAKGIPLSNLANAMSALRNAPEWRGVLIYDDLRCSIVKAKTAPYWKANEETEEFKGTGPWTDTDDIKTAEWLQINGLNIGVNVAAAAAQGVSEEHHVHPIRDYLKSIKWDGEARINRWLADYMGVEWSEYSAAIGAKWLISAVARVMSPGCQVDTCLVLEGEQGIRKSSALRTLAGDDWFSDQIADLDKSESSKDLNGKWIFEFSELDKFSKHEQGVIKSFIPRRIDHYRPSYGRRSQDFRRQCVFSATTNQSAYLGDETGGRRWWPVVCGNISLERLTTDRDQLWAEALAHYQDEVPWWIDDINLLSKTKEEQRARMIDDSWLNDIRSWIVDLSNECASQYTPGSVSVQEVLAKLGISLANFDQGKAARVAKCLAAEGWVRYKEGTGTRQWRYRRR